MQPVVLVHGGAGDIRESRVQSQLSGVKKAAFIGYTLLRNGGSSLDAAVEAIQSLESDGTFNCGIGSMLNEAGRVEMDASVMIGRDLSAGAVTGVCDVGHPIALARYVRDNCRQNLLTGDAVRRLVVAMKEPLLESGTIVTEYAQECFQNFKTDDFAEVGGAGVVVMDSEGHLAAGSSTGGMTCKMVGSIGSSAVIGAGVYADDQSAASVTTGKSESISKFLLAHSIVTEIKNGKSAAIATAKAVQEILDRFQTPAGAITISKDGDVGIDFTTDKMAWAYQRNNEMHSGIERGQHDVQIMRCFAKRKN